MNPKLFLTIFSFRKEITFVSLAFLIALSIPVIAVILLANIGLNVVSDQLVSTNPQTAEVTVQGIGGQPDVKIITQRVWPVTGVVTLEFGESSFFQVFHTGIDIANPSGQIGDPITPFMDGKVTYEGEIFWGYGKHIIIDHGNHITSVYGHLSKVFVVKNQEVKIGDIIGYEGKSGWATGPHLHFETRVYGLPVNPRVFLVGNPI